MTKTAKITSLLMLAAIVILGGWDVVVAANSTDGDTISELLLDLSLRRPIVPFVFGVVCGHLFWAQSPKKEDDDAS